MKPLGVSGESSPNGGKAQLTRSPLIAVDANGYCWRVFPGEFWSMCPVNPDNSPIPRPLTFYAPVEMTEAQALAMVNADADLFSEEPLPPTTKGTTLPTPERMAEYDRAINSGGQGHDDTIYGGTETDRQPSGQDAGNA